MADQRQRICAISNSAAHHAARRNLIGGTKISTHSISPRQIYFSVVDICGISPAAKPHAIPETVTQRYKKIFLRLRREMYMAEILRLS